MLRIAKHRFLHYLKGPNLYRILLLTTFFCCFLNLAKAQNSFEEKVTSASNIGMTVNNLGMIGNGFGGSYQVQGFPSCEYPQGSGIEHLFDGGLWIGAIVEGQANVSTGAVGDPSGYSTGKSGFEFSADPGSGLEERSSLVDNPNFSPKAVSHEDFVAEFTDANRRVPGTDIRISGHEDPLGVTVNYETYNWNYNFANFFVVLNFEIKNTGDQVLDSLYTGYWMDGVVRNVNITPPGGSPFYNKGGNGYIDSLQMAYEFDASGDTAYTKSYIGLKFLGAEKGNEFLHPELNDNMKANFQTWQFQNSSDPVYFSPNSDQGRYRKMSRGLNHNSSLEWSEVEAEIEQPSNRSNLLSAGSLGTLRPGESVTVAFAIVCGKMSETGDPVSANTVAQRQRLRQNASWAQRSYNGEDRNFNGQLDEGEDLNGNDEIDRYILPTPPDIPQTRYEPKEGKIEVYWADNAEQTIDPITQEKDFEGYRIYKSEFGYELSSDIDAQGALDPIAEFDKKGNEKFYNTGFKPIKLEEPKTFSDDTVKYDYRYTIDNIQSGWQHVVTVTAFDRGDKENNLQSLESSKVANAKHIFPGTTPSEDMEEDEPFVYPNPYYASAQWRGQSSFEEDRKMIFANLPQNCIVRIYNPAGDKIDEFKHNQDYEGKDIKWYSSFSNPEETEFSGGEHAWDLLSASNQIIARGIYLFSVEDLDTGKNYQSKFVIIK